MKLEYFKDTIGVYPGALDQSLCNEMIQEFKDQEEDGVYEGFTLGGKNYNSKRTFELNLKNTGNKNGTNTSKEIKNLFNNIKCTIQKNDRNADEDEDLSSFENMSDKFENSQIHNSNPKKIFKLDSAKKAWIAKQILSKIDFTNDS